MNAAVNAAVNAEKSRAKISGKATGLLFKGVNHISYGTIFIINVQYGLTMRLFRAEPLTFKAF